MDNNVNTFELSKNWFNFVTENSNVKAIHTHLYFFIINRWNTFFWTNNFSLPTDFTMEQINVRSYKTYIKALLELDEFGFINIIERSKNQNTANVIEVVKNTKANTKADTEALIKASTKSEHQSDNQSIDSIIKQINNITIEQLNTIKDAVDERFNILNVEENKGLYFINESDFLETWNLARKTLLKVESNIKSLYRNELTDFNLLKDKYTKEEFKDAMRGLFMQKEMFASNMLRPKHFLSDGNIDKYLDAFKNNTQLYKSKKPNDVKL